MEKPGERRITGVRKMQHEMQFQNTHGLLRGWINRKLGTFLLIILASKLQKYCAKIDKACGRHRRSILTQ